MPRRPVRRRSTWPPQHRSRRSPAAATGDRLILQAAVRRAISAFDNPSTASNTSPPERQPGPDRARPQHPLQPGTITLTQNQRRSNRQTHCPAPHTVNRVAHATLAARSVESLPNRQTITAAAWHVRPSSCSPTPPPHPSRMGFAVVKVVSMPSSCQWRSVRRSRPRPTNNAFYTRKCSEGKSHPQPSSPWPSQDQCVLHANLRTRQPDNPAHSAVT
jgi:hypothetical protein